VRTNVFFRLLASAAIAVLSVAPAGAAGTPIQDGAGMFSQGTISQLREQIENFTAQTGKQIVVVTVPSLDGKTASAAAEAIFQQQNINGMLIFIAKNDRQDWFLPDSATAQFFPESTIVSIRQSMEALFKAEDYDGGITAAVTGVLNVFRAHLGSLQGAGAQPQSYPAVPATTAVPSRRSGVHIGMFTFILLCIVGFLILRSIFRAMSGPRYYGGGMPGGGPAGPGPRYGPGYGGYGPGYYGGGGGFWSGLLGGLGGAWLGNEMFGNQGTTIVQQPGGAIMPTGDQGGSWGAPDAGGWANDAGQADMGAGSGGDWSGGGFGDFGGGGGFGGDGGGGGGW